MWLTLENKIYDAAKVILLVVSSQFSRGEYERIGWKKNPCKFISSCLHLKPYSSWQMNNEELFYWLPYCLTLETWGARWGVSWHKYTKLFALARYIVLKLRKFHCFTRFAINLTTKFVVKEEPLQLVKDSKDSSLSIFCQNADQFVVYLSKEKWKNYFYNLIKAKTDTLDEFCLAIFLTILLCCRRRQSERQMNEISMGGSSMTRNWYLQ